MKKEKSLERKWVPNTDSQQKNIMLFLLKDEDLVEGKEERLEGQQEIEGKRIRWRWTVD